jgi:hypothetical protein
MSFNKRFFPVGGIVASSEAACLTDDVNPFTGEVADGGVALYSLDYDGSDASGNYDGTPTNVEFGVGGQINYGARFNGSSSKIQVNSPIVNVSNDYTVSMWLNTSDVTSFKGIYENINTNGYLANQVLITIVSGTIRIYVVQTNGSSTIARYDFSGASLSTNTWHHLTFVLKTNNSHIAYIDGTSYSSAFNSTTSPTPSGYTTIGYGNGTSFNGDIDQVRIFSKALSQSEVDTLYAETACVYDCTTDTVNYPSGTTPVAYYKLDNSSEDYSTGGNDGTDTNVEYRFGRFGQAAVFNGSSSAIVVEDSSSNTFGFANHTGSVSAWVNIDSLSSENHILSKRDSGNPGNRQWYLRVLTSGAVEFELFNTDSNTDDVISTTTLNTNQWYHIVATLTTSNLKIYINGVEDASESSTYSTIQNAGADLEIGRRGKNSGYGYFDGSIDQVRIYDTALTSDQVTELYNEKQCYITKDASDPFGDSSEVAFYEMENNANDSTGSYNGTASNVTYSSDAIRGTYAASFNGSSSYVSIGSLGNLLYRQEFSVSVWFKTNSLPATQGTIFMLQDSNNNNTPYFSLNISSTGTLGYAARTNTSSLLNGATSVLPLDTWYNAVLQITSTGAEFYLNGGQYTDSALFTPSFVTNFSGNVYLGVRGLDWASVKQYYYNGSIDQVRIFNKALEGDQVFKLYAEGVRETGL